MNFWGQPESNRRASAVALSLMSPYTRFSRVSLALRATMYGRGNTSNRHILQAQYMVSRRELLLNARIMRGILRCPGNAHYPQGAPCSGFGYRIRQAVCKLRVCLCTSTFDAGISAPRWAQIGNTCVSFHAVSIHTEKVPHLPVALPLRPHADIGTYTAERPSSMPSAITHN